MKKLPIGIQHYPLLVEKKFLYVDKTKLIYQLINGQMGHFLSRPRRFGKSLIVSTLATLFQGKKEFFNDTWIGTSDYSFESFPVIWLDFSLLFGNDAESLQDSLQEALLFAAKELGIEITPGTTPAQTFVSLIRSASTKKRVVILIDEYDHPLLKVLENPGELVKVRDLFKEFYTVIKSLNRNIHYAFLTGVSKFSKVSLFSGMNNLNDITLDPEYSTLAGITEEELDAYYAPWIAEAAAKRNETLQEIREAMKKWYNGYCFSRLPNAKKVYNPLSLHLFFQEYSLSNFWFSTATPTFAIKLIKSENYPVVNLESGVSIGASLDDHHEVTRPNLIPLLFQTGYLTIDHYDEATQNYHLKFPNQEVKRSFFNHLLMGFTELDESNLTTHFRTLAKSLAEKNLKDFFEALNILFAEIPYSLHIAKESYYHSLIYLVLRSLKFKVESETPSSLGKLDMVVFQDHKIFIFEFKFNGSAQEAVDQIIEKGYASSYKNSGKEIILIGANINRQKRAIDDWITFELEH